METIEGIPDHLPAVGDALVFLRNDSRYSLLQTTAGTWTLRDEDGDIVGQLHLVQNAMYVLRRVSDSSQDMGASWQMLLANVT